jgi:Fic family protein
MGMSEHDAAYRPFDSFQHWTAVRVNTDLWDQYIGLADQARRSDPSAAADATVRSLRKAALNTGAIEGLHPAGRGMTATIVAHDAWQHAVALEAGSAAAEVVGHVEAALRAYDLVMDMATQQSDVPLVEATIRRLHEEATAYQDTYDVNVVVDGEVHVQRHALDHGAYKAMPNHVILANGSVHGYCPVDRVPDEMNRLVNDLRSPEFLEAHPVLQAGFAHYAFVCIHPFADGNGRVARLLASLYLLRASSVPLVIYEDQKADYLKALGVADGGHFQGFVDFVLARTVDAIGWATDAVHTASGSDRLLRLLTPAQRLLEELRSLIGSRLAETRTALGETWYLEDREGPAQFSQHPDLIAIRVLSIGVGYKFGDETNWRYVSAAATRAPSEFEVGVLVASPPDDRAPVLFRSEDVFPELRESVYGRLELLTERVVDGLIRQLLRLD